MYDCIVLSHGVRIVIPTVDTLHTNCAISHNLLVLFIYSSLSKPENSCMQDYKGA